MKKLFSASILFFSLTNTVLIAAWPPTPDPTELPPMSTWAAAAKAWPPTPDPTELPPVSENRSFNH